MLASYLCYKDINFVFILAFKTTIAQNVHKYSINVPEAFRSSDLCADILNHCSTYWNAVKYVSHALYLRAGILR